MTITRRFELPPAKQRVYDRVVRLEWLTIVYLISAVVLIYLTLGASQAMKAAWLEDLLSLTPPIAFLVAGRFRDRRPNDEYPYGYHRSVSIAFLCASIALTAMGLFLMYDSVMKLVSFEHPSIGTVQPFGGPIWLGWLMIPALVWSAVPAFILGRMKLPLARELHDKVLYADAEMNKADWMTASAAIVGVLGIGVGLWWADAAAAIVIAFDIAYDGVRNLRAVVGDLMDQRPTSVERGTKDPVTARVENEVNKMPWVREARVRLREEGHVYFGEILVVPTSEKALLDNIGKAQDHIHSLDWKLHEVVIMPVRSMAADELAEATERADGGTLDDG